MIVMSPRFGEFRPGVLTALATVGMIATWRGRTFLDDNAVLDDVAHFVPAEEPASSPRAFEDSVLADTVRPELELDAAAQPPSRSGRTAAA